MMQHHNDNDDVDVVPKNLLVADLWDAISQMMAKWIDATRCGDDTRAATAEQELRFFALYYVSLPIDTDHVTTGRKAVLRSLYDRLGFDATELASIMLDSVISHEERVARQGAGREAER